ncbi:MAG: hypothetical protein ACLPVY_21880 [Acidimicrobiia bacterium]
MFSRHDGGLHFIDYTLDELEVRDCRLRFELLNRHDTAHRTLMPTSGDALVVAPPMSISPSRHTSTR